MNDLNRTLTEIGRLADRNALAAPNDWESYRDKERTDRGTDLPFDFEVLDHGSVVVLYPVSNPAREWFAAHLPGDCPRWGAEGYVIERRYVSDIVDGLRRDKLISEDEYEENMNLNEELNQQDWDFAEYQGEER